MDEILIYGAIKFQRVVPARAKFVRFMRSQFESFSLTVKPPKGNGGAVGRGWGGKAGKTGECGTAVVGKKKLEQEPKESTGRRGTSY